MKIGVFAVLLLLGGLPLTTLGGHSPGRLPRTYFYGSEYVRIDEWARSHGFQTSWRTPKDELRVTSPYTSLTFNVDSRRATINGVAVWLSTPVAYRNGAAYIAPTDLATAINPVLFPQKNPPRERVVTICLDPGHGGRDPGNREGKFQEKRYTLLLAQEVKSALSKAGFKVVLTRTGDSYPELSARPDFARRHKADLFVSLHFNSADSAGARTVQGVEVYCLTPARARSTNARGHSGGAGSAVGNRNDSQNMLLAYQLQRALVQRLGAEDRGVRRARFEVLRVAEMPAVLIEAGFMTHPVESKKIYNASHRQQMAQAIAAGILAYKRAVEPTAK
ncbi:MAG: N-acetylmuramoyl-L-alanine amidase [Verrucomicrobia subdivision 3 bacterium]|nr:N-acetylmuramoyl-L-alanine amidase [Limisphaerales bacterium]